MKKLLNYLRYKVFRIKRKGYILTKDSNGFYAEYKYIPYDWCAEYFEVIR